MTALLEFYVMLIVLLEYINAKLYIPAQRSLPYQLKWGGSNQYQANIELFTINSESLLT